MNDKPRCQWANVSPAMAAYHDAEWGTPPADDDGYFESLTLEIFEAGLNWTLIFNKREWFRSAFDGFSVGAVARYTSEDVERIMATPNIVHNRRKVEAAMANAAEFVRIQGEHGSFRAWLNGLRGAEPNLVKELGCRFSFVGPSVARSFLHDVGRTSGRHEPACWRSRG